MAALSIIAQPLLRHSFRPLLRHPPSSSVSNLRFSRFEPPIIQHCQFSWQSATTVIPDYFTHWSLTQACQWTLESVHIHTGLPWWATIVGTTVAFKLLTSPLLYAGERVLARYSLSKAMVARYVPGIRAEVDRLAALANLPQEKKDMWVKLGTKKAERLVSHQMQSHPLAMICWPLLQAPVWISMSFAVRNLSGRNPFYLEYDDLIVEELSREGLWWFSNMTVPDPLWILPLANCALYLLAPMISALGTPLSMQKSPFYRISRAVNVGVTLIITYVGMHLPAVVTVYWLTSMLVTIILRLILKLPRLRRKLAIDRSPFESQTPIKELMLRIVGKWNPETVKSKNISPSA